MSQSSGGAVLHSQLARWQAAGLIDAGQAAGIEAAEAGDAGDAGPGRPPAPPRSPRRAIVVEALGYLGAVLAAMAGFIAIGDLWPGIPAGAGLALAAGTASVLLAAGVVAGRTSRSRRAAQPGLRRLRSVLWLASAGSLAAFAVVLTGPSFAGYGLTVRLLSAEAVTAGYLAVLWWRSQAALLHLALFAAAAALDGTAIARAWPGAAGWAPGLGVWALALVWGLAAYRGWLVSATAGYLAAAAGLLAGAQLGIAAAGGPALALATVTGLLTAGVLARRVLLVGAGGLGALVLLPQVASRYLPAGAAGAGAVLAAGLVILAAALWLARRNATPAGAA
ncbi:MAG TPA: hypothetical protein VGG35_05820 [Streptosporangiaceae bacterium]|jgi:hypothetical protein